MKVVKLLPPAFVYTVAEYYLGHIVRSLLLV